MLLMGVKRENPLVAQLPGFYMKVSNFVIAFLKEIQRKYFTCIIVNDGILSPTKFD